MNKEEIENKLECLKGSKQHFIESHNEVIESLEAQLAQLAEAEKPKLRHGDYGYWGDTKIHPFIIDESEKEKDGKTAFLWHNNDLRNKKEAYYYKNYIRILGNIFDDLKALGKPLEEFTVGDVEVSIDHDGDLKIKDVEDDDLIYIEKRNIHDFILNLRRMEAFQATIESAGGKE